MRKPKELGYFLAVTALENTGEGRDSTLEMYCFRLFFRCITFKWKRRYFRGHCTQGAEAWGLLELWTCEKHLSYLKMPDYCYVAGEYPVFLNDKLSKIEKDVLICFIVIGTK
nr:dna-directed rna polymerase v subunit 7 [Quercus suber]